MKYQVVKSFWCGWNAHVKIGESIYGNNRDLYMIDDINAAFHLMNKYQNTYGCKCLLEVVEYKSM